MAPVNTLRMILVAGAVVAAVAALVFKAWLAAGLLAVGIVGHALLWVHLHRTGGADRDRGSGPAVSTTADSGA